MKIDFIEAREILTSKGNPTVEVCLVTDKGRFIASAPSGVSTGDYEAVEIPAHEAVKKIVEIESLLKGRDFSGQEEFDGFLIKQDGTGNKSSLGANAMLALSIAFARAAAFESNQELFDYLSREIFSSPAVANKMPVPAMLCLEGGRHGKGKASIQEFIVVPQKNSFEKNFAAGRMIFNALKSILEKDLGKDAFEAGVEGAFALKNLNSEEALSFLNRAIDESGNKGAKIYLDIAASEFFQNQIYFFDGREIEAAGLADFYDEITGRYPVSFIEDLFSQDDAANWHNFKAKTENQGLKVIGDDLTVTNSQRIRYAQENGLCNGVIIKPNQIGTVWETLQAVALAKEFGWKIIVSHRAGETEDSFIADLAVAVAADFIKAGGLSQSVRMAKYNRLLEIEKSLLSPS
ncbi:MAG: phosphopyruvate hydratase [Candidatus Pacebacteria bacterium]|nr:phosphopyruvate hydratase [Candidatus Paceibacterota bacterium]